MACWWLAMLPLVWGGWVYPEQVRIAWTERENEMRVTWVTFLPTSTQVWFRPILCEQSGDSIATGEYRKINVAQFLERTEYIHIVTLTGLSAACTYEYQVGNGWFWSHKYQFSGRTPDYSPPYDDLDNPSSVIIFGDWGMGPWGWHTLNLLEHEADNLNFDAIIHIGDIAYDLFGLNGLIGDMYLRMIEPVAARIPYMVGPGNHEDFNNMTQYKERFAMPINSANQGTNTFFSFNLGAAHYIVLNTEWLLETDPAYDGAKQTEINWLTQDLIQANKERDIRPWIILGTHQPIYCSQNWTLPGSPYCGALPHPFYPILEDLYYNSKIDLVVQAHIHYYERDTPIYRNETILSEYDDFHTHVNPQAPIYVISGNGGNEEGYTQLDTNQRRWFQTGSTEYGFGKITVNQTHLYWQQFSSIRSEEIDYMWVVKTGKQLDRNTGQ